MAITAAASTAVGAAVGGAQGAGAALNEVGNNYFAHPSDYENRKKALLACNGSADPKGCESAVRQAYSNLYDENERAVAKCAGRDACLNQLASIRTSQAEYAAKIGELLSKGASLSVEEAKLLVELQAGTSGLESIKSLAIGRSLSFGASSAETAVALGITDIAIGVAPGVGVTTGKTGGKGGTTTVEDVAATANTGLNVGEGVVASRVNVRVGDANVTGSGLEYAWKKHGGAWADNKSAFTISKDELKVMLQDPLVVNTPAYQSVTSGNYIRTVDMGRTVGIDAKSGGQPTNFMTVITDSKGNLVNTFPGKTF
jgi:hypothetical protein